MFTYLLITIFGIGLLIWAFWYDKNMFKPEKKKNGKTAVGLLLFLFLMSGAGKAQAETVNPEDKTDYTTYIQTVYNRENGLPGGCANDIAQTADGILLIGSSEMW